MIFKLILLFYIVPLVLCFLFEYLCMKKGESLEEYLERTKSDKFGLLLLFVPIVNIIYSFSAILYLIVFSINEDIVTPLWDKIKKFRK